MTKLENRSTKKSYIKLLWYDKKYYRLPISKAYNWFSDKRGNSHCVVGCYNHSDVFYVTDKGLISIGYCLSHAENRIMRIMMTGILERGLWCTILSGKLQPHPTYTDMMEYLRYSKPKQAKKLELKIKHWKQFLNIKGIPMKRRKRN